MSVQIVAAEYKFMYTKPYNTIKSHYNETATCGDERGQNIKRNKTHSHLLNTVDTEGLV